MGALPFVADLGLAVWLRSIVVVASVACGATIVSAAPDPNAFVRMPAKATKQLGGVPAVAAADRLVLANEPDGTNAGLRADFDLETVAQSATPLARLQLGDVEKLRVVRPGHSPGIERGAMHVFVRDLSDSALELAGSLPVKPDGKSSTYTFDVTGAINTALARPARSRKISFELHMVGKPLFHEVYALPAAKLVLEIAPAAGWVDDRDQRLVPITQGPVVYRESCLPLTAQNGREVVLPLLFPAKRILEVVHNAAGGRLHEGRDWILRDGKLVLPPGSRAPVQFDSEFFMISRKTKDGTVATERSEIRVNGGSWYHARQIEVNYEPAIRDWSWSAPLSSLEQLPRVKGLLAAKAPLSLLLFGDSIAAGYNVSKLTGVWPYQPTFGELVAHKLGEVCGGRISFMNHSRGGATSQQAAALADAQVAWFKPDLVLLAYGMNDLAPERSAGHRANLEQIIDTVRARSPRTEFIIITPMPNNPKQPAGHEPVKFIRAEALKISRPGIGFVDMTTTGLEMLNRKGYLDLSGNGINHPNDYLARIYAQRILEVLLPQPAVPVPGNIDHQ